MWSQYNKNIVMKYIQYIFYVIYSCDGKAEFSAVLSSLSNDPLEISHADLLLKKHFLLLMLKTIVLLNIFCGNRDALFD